MRTRSTLSRFLADPAVQRPLRPFAAQLLHTLLLLGLLGGILLITGCRGCGSSDPNSKETEEKKEGEEPEKKKPDFINRTPVLLPGYYPPKYDPQNEKELEKLSADVREAIEIRNNAALRNNRHKLGHWVEAHLSVIANNFNADGRLLSHSLNVIGDPVPVPSTEYFAATQRPVTLTKGEWKNLEVPVFLPRREKGITSATVNYVFDRGTGGIPYVSLSQGTQLMRAYQYHVVILSDRPDSYNFFKLTDTVRLRGSHFEEEQQSQFYYVVPTLFDEPVPLPRQSLNWTTIAYVIWDDFDPTGLSTDQQQALVDWLHFGGQLILSGPDSLSKLQNSFLADYLPAQFAGSRNLTAEDFVELNQNWTLPVPKSRADIGQRALQIDEKNPLLGVRFAPHADAQFVQGTGDLAIERSVGRGRIMITAFSLNAPGVRKWQSFQSFVHGAVMRLPARTFSGRMNSVRVSYKDQLTSLYDPLMGSTLRYLSRDLSAVGTLELPNFSLLQEQQDQMDRQAYLMETPTPEQTFSVERKVAQGQHFFGGYQDSPYSGVAGWNDDSAISSAARKTLLEAAGIVPPSSAFVLKMLGIYLAVLVPLNWLLFRILGRVEWAWIAAPFIAIAGAVMVVRMASLDIGFVRSNTQVGIVEVHANYPRAHVAQYSALYTSLSTRYNVELDNLTAQSLPFAPVSELLFRKPSTPLKGVTLKRTSQNRLEGMPIQSNSTGLLHTEFMLDLEGTVYATFGEQGTPETINNGSSLAIQNAGVVWRDEQGSYQLAWVGEIPSGVTADLSFSPTTVDDYLARWQELEVFDNNERRARMIWKLYFPDRETAGFEEVVKIKELAPFRDQFEAALLRLIQDRGTDVTLNDLESALSSIKTSSKVAMGRLLDALKNLSLSPGEVRLLGSTDQPLGSTKFDPEATRNDRQSLIVVHLRQPELKPAERDFNSVQDFIPVSNLDFENPDEEEE